MLHSQKVDLNENQNSLSNWIIEILTKERLSKKLKSKENSMMNLMIQNGRKIIQG